MKRLSAELASFKPCFSRASAHDWFMRHTVAFMLRQDHLGVTSFMRTLPMRPDRYDAGLHFYRSDAYTTDGLRTQWHNVVKGHSNLLKVNGRYVLIGDGVKQSKEGRHMPGVNKQHQESEDSSKGEYIFGHMFGGVAVLMADKDQTLALPMTINLQGGIRAAADWEGSTISAETHVIQMIEKGHEAARNLGGKSYLVMDRYFSNARAAKRCMLLNRQYGGQVDLVFKMKMNAKAYEDPPPKVPGKKGRPRKKGDSFHLSKYFDNLKEFKSADVAIYDGVHHIQYLEKEFLWGKALYHRTKFVFVIDNGQRMILASTDTSLSALEIIQLYALRFKIEHTFREFKQQIGGFGYHFWSKDIGKLDHFRKKGEPDELSKITDPDARQRILKTLDAIDRFVLVACIAMGLVQMMIFEADDKDSIQACRWLRTRRKGRISEATMMDYLRSSFFVILPLHPELPLNALILRDLAEKVAYAENSTKKAG